MRCDRRGRCVLESLTYLKGGHTVVSLRRGSFRRGSACGEVQAKAFAVIEAKSFGNGNEKAILAARCRLSVWCCKRPTKVWRVGEVRGCVARTTKARAPPRHLNARRPLRLPCQASSSNPQSECFLGNSPCTAETSPGEGNAAPTCPRIRHFFARLTSCAQSDRGEKQSAPLEQSELCLDPERQLRDLRYSCALGSAVPGVAAAPAILLSVIEVPLSARRQPAREQAGGSNPATMVTTDAWLLGSHAPLLQTFSLG